MRPRIIYMPQSDRAIKWHWVAERVETQQKQLSVSRQFSAVEVILALLH